MVSYITASIGRISRENALKIMTLPNEEGQGSTVGDAVVFFLCCTICTHLFFLILFSPLTSFPFFFTAREVFARNVVLVYLVSFQGFSICWTCQRTSP